MQARTNAGAQSEWSDPRSFRTDIIPTVPVQSMPTDGAEALSMMNTLTFAWESSPGAATYGLRVIDTSGTYIVEELDLATTSHAVTPEGVLVAGASYAWQVRACTGAGCSPWSQPAWTFTMEEEGPPGSTETKRYYYLTDHLGSVRATVDETGTVVSYSDYYPFGMQMDGRTHAENAKHTRENYTGHELDRESEMLYAGARYYDPLIGRWPVVDALVDQFPSHSPYNYAVNNPLSFIDPNGLDTTDVMTVPLFSDNNCEIESCTVTSIGIGGEVIYGKAARRVLNALPIFPGALGNGIGGSAAIELADDGTLQIVFSGRLLRTTVGTYAAEGGLILGVSNGLSTNEQLSAVFSGILGDGVAMEGSISVPLNNLEDSGNVLEALQHAGYEVTLGVGGGAAAGIGVQGDLVIPITKLPNRNIRIPQDFVNRVGRNIGLGPGF